MSARHRRREHDAIARLLGPGEASGGPFVLLGLPVAEPSDEQVLTALDQQLARLASHREGETPEADEVRLALHTAAAQLLDPRVRLRLLEKWAAREPGASPSAPGPPAPARGEPPAPQAAAAPPIPESLRREAMAAIASCGGWNAEATRRVLALAARHGMDGAQAATLFRAVFNLPSAPPTAAGAPAPAERSPRPRPDAAPVPATPAEVLPEQADPGRRILKIAAIAGLGFLATLAAAVILAILLIEASTPPPPPEPAPGTPTTIAQAPAPAPAPAESSPPPPAPPDQAGELDAESAGRELRACAKALESDPAQAAEGFARAVRAVAAGWPSLSPERHVSTQQDVIEFLYRAAGQEAVLRRAVAALGEPAGALAGDRPLEPGQVAPAAWSAGILTRLLREKDLPASLDREARRLLEAALAERAPASEHTFEAGARVAARLMPLRLVRPAGPSLDGGGGPPGVAPSPTGWERWLAVTAALEPDAPARARAVLAGVEALLIDGPEPTENETVFRAVRTLVASVTWRSGDESRLWLLRLFDDPRATSADLHAATSSVATASSAENVDVTMVVPVLASARVRAEFRKRYARAWGLESTSERDALLARLEQEARRLGERADADASPAAALATAVVLSRFSHAAQALWAGRPDAAEALLDRLQDGAEPPPPAPSASPPATPGAAPAPADGAIVLGGTGRVRGTWAERYLSAKKNVPVRAQLLDEFPRSGGQASSADAEVLMYEAIRGTPTDIRARARDVAMAAAAETSVVNALLELLPETPATAANTTLIEAVAGGSMPPPSSREWESQARRLLVERLIELLAAGGDLARVDDLAALLAESYDGRTRPPPAPAVATPAAPAAPAEQSAALLWRQWRDRVDPAALASVGGLTLEGAERRRAGRLALARGRVQTFAAHQASLCELMGLAVASERPGAAARVARTLAEWQDRRARAPHILGQVQATERAMAELWLIRVTGGAA